MRIGLISGEYPPMQGGVGDFTRELAKALTNLGHEIHVITRVGSTSGQVRRASDESGNPPCTTCPIVHRLTSRWGWRSYRRVMNLTRRLRLDVLNIQYQSAAYDLHPAINFYPLFASMSIFGRRRVPPIIVTFHDLKVPYLFPKAGPLRERSVTWLARRADSVIVTNRADELALQTRGIRRIERIPIGSNIEPTLPVNYDRVAWRAQFKLAPEDILLGFFGFLNARKGVETLVKALAILQADEGNPNGSSQPNSLRYHLLFIGGTTGSSDATNRAYADHIRDLIAQLGLKDRVHYTGFVPHVEVSAAFAAVDLCVLPYTDGISFHHGTLMAALAHSQPIISTRPAVELPELVHGENVWLVPPEEPEALAAAITTVAAEPSSRLRLAREAGELSIQFSWQSIAERTADLFTRVKLKA
jgi:glycosyltransferase involved in cell wall biosynthesis